jgi:hypothetical protein
MGLDNRENHVLVFMGEGSLPSLVIREGDEATLYHKGNLIMATIKAIKGEQIEGVISRSAYDPNRHKEYETGNEIQFTEQNIFGISRKERKV